MATPQKKQSDDRKLSDAKDSKSQSSRTSLESDRKTEDKDRDSQSKRSL